MKNKLIYSKDGLELTKQFEGCKFKSYQDVGGVWTIGYGHTFEVQPNQTCTQEQADKWLLIDIAWAVNVVNKCVEIQLNQHEFDALVDLVFNIGSGNFMKSTLLKKLNYPGYDGEDDEFLKWDKVKGKEVQGLLNRRKAEVQEFNEANFDEGM